LSQHQWPSLPTTSRFASASGAAVTATAARYVAAIARRSVAAVDALETLLDDASAYAAASARARANAEAHLRDRAGKAADLLA